MKCNIFYIITSILLYLFCDIYSEEVRTASWLIHWNNQDAYATNEKSGKTLLIYKQKCRDTTLGDSKSKTAVKFTDKYRMLSIVGSYVSYRHTFSSEPYIHQTSCGDEFVTIDLNQGGYHVSLDEIFNEKDIFAALSHDGFIKTKITQPNNLEELLNAISSGCELFMIEGDFLKSFTFHHVENGNVAIRLGMSHLCDITSGKFIQLGILLPIPADKKIAFEQASHQNLLMEGMTKKR
jgi:hypothetical protein